MSDNTFDARNFVREIPQDKGPAPVHLWDPPFCGDIDMRIASDGVWYYQGSPVQRPAMVRLFSSILRRDDDGCFYLVTPVEKVRIQVDDCPFAAVLVERKGGRADAELIFTLNTGETVVADSDHRLSFNQTESSDPHPVLHVRNGLYALLARNVYYQLVDMAMDEHSEGRDEQIAGVYSKGEFFPLS